MQTEKNLPLRKWQRTTLIALALFLLVIMYLFQQFNFLHYFTSFLPFRQQKIHPYLFFIFNKSLRLIINDLCCFVLIFVCFKERKYLKVAFWVFLFEFFILLPLYLVLKLSLEGDSEISSPLLSQLHRLIINPTLMILLLIAFFYQRFKAQKNSF